MPDLTSLAGIKPFPAAGADMDFRGHTFMVKRWTVDETEQFEKQVEQSRPELLDFKEGVSNEQDRKGRKQKGVFYGSQTEYLEYLRNYQREWSPARQRMCLLAALGSETETDLFLKLAGNEHGEEAPLTEEETESLVFTFVRIARGAVDPFNPQDGEDPKGRG